MAGDIPLVLQDVVQLVQNSEVKEAIQFYHTFMEYVLGKKPPLELLPNLKVISRKCFNDIST